MTTYQREWINVVTKPKRLLLVDDSKRDCQIIEQMTRAYLVDWEMVHSYDVAIQKIRQNPDFHMVILDLRLGVPDGIDVFARIKRMWTEESLKTRRPPVLILSGWIDSDSVARVLQIGFAMFAPKPDLFTEEYFADMFSVLNIPKRPLPVEEPVEI